MFRTLRLLGVMGLFCTAIPLLGQATAPAASQPATRPSSTDPTPLPDWKVTADPYAGDWKAQGAIRQAIVLKGRGRIFASLQPSPFVVIADEESGNHFWQLLDIRTGALQDKFKVNPRLEDAVIAPDGTHYAGTIKPASGEAGPLAIEVWSVGKPPKLVKTLSEPDTRRFQPVAFLDSDRLLLWRTGRTMTLELWDVKQGTRVWTTAALSSNVTVALSPNGKYIMLITDDLLALDARTGETLGTVEDVGVLLGAGPGKQFRVDNLTYSQDGRELALLYEERTDKTRSHRIVTRDMATGRVITNIALNLPPLAVQPVNPSFQITPDNQYFRIGLQMVDRDTGEVIYTFDNPVGQLPRNVTSYSSFQWMYDPEHLFLAAAPTTRVGLLTLDVPQEFLARARQVAEVGGIAEDVNMPPLTAADVSSARVLQPATAPATSPAAPPAWSLQIDAPVRTPGATPAFRALPLSHVRSDKVDPALQDCHFTGPAANEAILTWVILDRTTNSSTRSLVFERLDLATGLTRATFSPPTLNSWLASVSLDGNRFVCATKSRIDLYEWDNAKSARHVLGFRPPAADKSGPAFPITAAAILSDTHLLTFSRYEAIVWSIPACKAVYRIQATAYPALSPNRKQIAIPQPDAILILDSATGAQLARLPLPRTTGFGSLAFHPDGHRLAARRRDLNELHVWDLKTGERIAFGLPHADNGGAPAFRWVGEHYIMCGNSLVDIRTRTVLWSFSAMAAKPYGTPPPNLAAAPDTLHWTAIDPRYGSIEDRRIQLVSTPVPPAEALRAAAAIKPDDILVIKPGARVAVAVNVTGAGDVQQRIRDTLTEQLKAHKAIIDPTAPTRIVVTSKTVRQHPGGGAAFYEAKLTVVAGGRIALEHKMEGLGITSTQVVEKFFALYVLPETVAHTSAAGLGHSEITARGLITRPRR